MPTLCFTPGGRVETLYTELIDLRDLGPLTVTRATNIRFNPTTQQWDVLDAATGTCLHSHPSRHHCLTWETQNLGPK